MQLAIDFSPRDAGIAAASACLAAAEKRDGFDAAGAAKFILGQLHRFGPTAGEKLTDDAIEHGYRCQDSRAYGPVFAGLARKGLIRCVGYCERTKGHGTAGGRVWSAVL